MNIINTRPMPRGILGAVRAEQLDPGTVLAELNRSVTDFKNDQGRRLEAVEADIDRLTTAHAGAIASVGGGMAAHRAAAEGRVVTRDGDSADLKTLAAFARRGENSDLRQFVRANGPRADMSIASDPDGGFTVLPTVDQNIRILARDASPIRALASVVTISTSEYKTIVSYGLPSVGWVGERDSRPKLDGVTFKEVCIPVSEMYAEPALSQSLLDDSMVDIGAHVTGQIANAFAIVEDNGFVSGDGVLKPTGFLTYGLSTAVDFDSNGLPVRPWKQIQYIPTLGSGTDTTRDQWVQALVSCSLQLRAMYRNSAVWLMNRATAAVIRGLVDDTGRLLWSQDGRLPAGTPPTLLGFNVVLTESMPDIGANSTPILLAAMGAFYQIVDRIGIRILRDPISARPLILFYTTKRVGGGVVDFNAGKLIRCSTS